MQSNPVHSSFGSNVNTTMQRLRSRSLLFLACAALATPLLADGRNPGSLFVFPYFRHNAGTPPPGRNTLITVSNTASTEAFVHFVFVRGNGAQPSPCAKLIDRTERLAPCDTFSVLTNPFAGTTATEGFAYAFAVDRLAPPWRPVSFNHLIADVVILDGVLIGTNYSANPATFRAISAVDNTPIGAAPASINPIPLLDDAMYEAAPERILIPRFMGQSADYESSLVLLSLAGTGSSSSNLFETVVDLLVFNDNEEAFSAQHAFRCWTKIRLSDLNGIFTHQFLADNTNDDSSEIFGATTREAGWMFLEGNIASATQTEIDDPAILAFLIESTDVDPVDAEAGAELPFFLGSRDGRVAP
jgi:hypothetical protein